jgi:hypothetical protein
VAKKKKDILRAKGAIGLAGEREEEEEERLECRSLSVMRATMCSLSSAQQKLPATASTRPRSTSLQTVRQNTCVESGCRLVCTWEPEVAITPFGPRTRGYVVRKEGEECDG